VLAFTGVNPFVDNPVGKSTRIVHLPNLSAVLLLSSNKTSREHPHVEPAQLCETKGLSHNNNATTVDYRGRLMAGRIWADLSDHR
jgi:hypothetical protein